MKAKADKTTFSKAIANVSRALRPRPVHEWEECIVINVDDGGMTLITSNSDERIRQAIECDALEHGTVMVSGKMLGALINKMDADETVHLESDEKTLKLRVGVQKARLTAMPHDKFPDEPVIENPNILRANAIDIATAFSGAQYAIAKEQTRQVLTGALLEADKGKLFTVGLDGYRMSAFRVLCDHNEDGRYVVPGEAISIAATFAKTVTDDICTIEASDKRIRFHFGEITFDSVLLAGTYPDWKNVVPSDFRAEARINAKELLSAAELASVATSTTYAIRVEVSENGITMTANGDTAGTEQELNADVQMYGEPVKSAYSARFLSDAMKACTTDEIVFKVAGETRPAVFAPETGNDFLMLVLPVRVMG